MRQWEDTYPVAGYDRRADELVQRVCTGPCQQGRLPCPTPQACEQPAPASGARVGVLLVLVSAVIAVLLCAALAHWLAGVMA